MIEAGYHAKNKSRVLLLILAGYAWDRSMIQRLKSLRTTITVATDEPDDESEQTADE